MHLSKSFPLKAARHIGAHLTVLAALTLMNGVGFGQTPAPVKVNPETGTPVQTNRQRPPRPIDTPYAKAALATMRAPLDKLTPVTDGARCFAEWSAEFDCDEGREHALVETIGDGVVQGGFDALKRHFARR